MNVMVSVIVPVYNVEKYLGKCIQSLINQSYKNIEILLIDDGSPDNCPKMCDLYASQYECIRSLHKINGGLSSARNYGVRHAKGQYIVFVDSDDYVESSYIEDLIILKNKYNTELVITRTSRENEDGSGKTNVIFDDFLVDTKEALFYVYTQTKVGWAAYGKLYPREVLLKHPFPDGYFEDSACMYRIINEFDKIAIGCCCDNYHYVQHEGSILISELNDKHYRIFEICEEFQTFLSEEYPDLYILSVYMKYHAVVQLLILQKMAWDKYKDIFMLYRNIFRKELKNIVFEKKISNRKKIYYILLCTRPEFFALPKFIKKILSK